MVNNKKNANEAKMSDIFRKMIENLKKVSEAKGKNFFQKFLLSLKVIGTFIGDAFAAIIYGRKVFKFDNEMDEQVSEKVKNPLAKEEAEPEQKQENEKENNEINEENVQKENVLSEKTKRFIGDYEEYLNNSFGAIIGNQDFVVDADKDNENILYIKGNNITFSLNRKTGDISMCDDIGLEKDDVTKLLTIVSGSYCEFSQKNKNDFTIDNDFVEKAMCELSYFIDSKDKEHNFYINGVKFNYLKGENLQLTFSTSIKTYANDERNKHELKSIAYPIESYSAEKIKEDFIKMANKTQEFSAANFKDYISDSKKKTAILDTYIKNECTKCFPDAEITSEYADGKIMIHSITKDDKKFSFEIDKNRSVKSDFTERETDILNKVMDKCICEIYDSSELMPSQNRIRRDIHSSIAGKEQVNTNICGVNFNITQSKGPLYIIKAANKDTAEQYIFNKNDKKAVGEAAAFATKYIEEAIKQNASNFEISKENFLSNDFEKGFPKNDEIPQNNDDTVVIEDLDR